MNILFLPELTMSPPELGLTRENSLKGQCSTPSQLPQLGRLTAWLVDANPPLELAVKELSQAQQSINQLSQILQQLESSSSYATDTEVCKFLMIFLHFLAYFLCTLNSINHLSVNWFFM